jgi:hypothetical protein
MGYTVRGGTLTNKHRLIEIHILQASAVLAPMPSDNIATQAVLKWVAHHAAITEPDKLPLCLDCDETFTATRRPHFFAVMSDPGKELCNVSGICRACVDRADHGEGLRPMAVRRMRTILPSLQVLPVLGHG